MKTIDLGRYMRLGAQVAEYAAAEFGFEKDRVLALEIDGSCDPDVGCMFEVCGIEYRVEGGRIRIHCQPGDVPPDEDD